MAKVNVRYGIRSVYNVLQYRQTTLEMDLPKDHHGFILMPDLSKIVANELKCLDGFSHIVWLRIVK